MAGNWSIVLGVIIFSIALLVAIIYYLRYKKWFLVIYTASISTYIFSVFYVWDIFDLKGISVMSLLLISMIIMIFLGKYFSKIKLKKDKVHTSLKEKENEE